MSDMQINGRSIYECANQLEGYVDGGTPERLAAFLMREGQAASDLADALDTATRINAALVAALRYARQHVAKYAHTQGDSAVFHAELLAPIDAALAAAPALSKFETAELDMIRHGDMLGPELGQRVGAALSAHTRTGYVTVDPSEGEQAKPAYPDPVEDTARRCAEIADAMHGWMQPRDVAAKIRREFGLHFDEDERR